MQAGNWRPAASSRGELWSQIATKRLSGFAEKLRARFGPQYPYPTSPIPTIPGPDHLLVSQCAIIARYYPARNQK